jgi:hypothetical protein
MAFKKNVATTIAFLAGSLMTWNFAVFWAAPVVIQGMFLHNRVFYLPYTHYKYYSCLGLFYKFSAKPLLDYLFNSLDTNPYLRSFAEKYVYTNPRHADFFVTTVLLIINATAGITIMFYWQLTYGSLPFWLIYLYYFSWVGVGGRVMGSAYALAHKEVIKTY